MRTCPTCSREFMMSQRHSAPTTAAAQRSLLARDHLLRDAGRTRSVRRPSVPSLLVKHMAEPPQPPSDLCPDIPPGHRVDRPAPAREGLGPPLPERRGPVRGLRGSRSGRAGRQRADACGRYDPEPRAPGPERGGGRDDHGRAPRMIDCRALDPAVSVGNAPGATISDERPSHPVGGPILGGIPKTILPTPRDSRTARRPAQ